MEPYYADTSVTLYHGDCREVLPLLARGSVDLLLTDPPYGVQWEPTSWRRDREGPSAIAGDDGSLDVAAVLAATLPLLRPFRHVYVFGPADLASLPLGKTADLVWNKEHNGGLGDLSLPWAPSHERITFAVYLPWEANRAKNRGEAIARLRRGSVLTYLLPPQRTRHHPHEKPTLLLRELIECSSKFGETVFDPFAGSGSTLVAAKLEGRKAIGVELEERYCEVAVNRLRMMQPALALFQEAAG